MKRINNLFPILISDDNIRLAIETVNRTHRRRKGVLNKTVIWIENTIDDRIIDLRNMMIRGFYPSKARVSRRYDHSAGKWREIHEPPLWPDQYVHHMVVQTLQPVMMRGMDYWCCGSIKGRGAKRGISGIQKWMRTDPKNTKYAAEIDIYHLYESLSPVIVFDRMLHLIKDKRMLWTIWRLIRDGITIGAYFSQWFANTTLQTLDHLIREKLHIKHYVRYMDNITIFESNKKRLRNAVNEIKSWLKAHMMKIKSNYQIYRTSSRMVSAMGYRFGHDKTILKKRTLLRFKRHVSRVCKRIDSHKAISFKQAAGIISRIGMLKHCNSRFIKKRYIRPGLMRIMKKIIKTQNLFLQQPA